MLPDGIRQKLQCVHVEILAGLVAPRLNVLQRQLCDRSLALKAVVVQQRVKIPAETAFALSHTLFLSQMRDASSFATLRYSFVPLPDLS